MGPDRKGISDPGGDRAHREIPSTRRRRDLLLIALLFVLGTGSAIYRYWPALTTYEIYHSDTRQSPHWAAYHGHSFRADDILVEYGRFNESPLQNAIYFVATWFGDFISVSKLLAVAANGLTTCLFFLAGRAMYGMRAGILLSLFFTFFPSSFRYAEGFFSKFWAAPLLLLCLFALHARRFRWFVVLIPFAVLAYPMMAVLIGATGGLFLVMLWFGDRPEARRLFLSLALGSTIAVLMLAIKYVSPPDFVGPMIPRAEILADPIGGAAEYVPIPSLFSELARWLANPFVIFGTLLYVAVLRREIAWDRSMVALFVASAVLYVIADLVFPQLYVPDRYTGYSVAVLLVVWHATNIDRLLARIPRRLPRYAVLAALFLAAGASYYGRSGRHMTRNGLAVADVAAFIRTLPEGSLIAGPPRFLDDIAIQAKRSVLSSYKLNHGWYAGISEILHERTMAIFRATYAFDDGPVNDLHERYGATHLVLQRSYFGWRLESGEFRSRYDDEIAQAVEARTDFLLRAPPLESIVYDDGTFRVLSLPIRDPRGPNSPAP